MTTHAGEDVEQREHLFTAVGMQTCIATMEINVAASQKDEAHPTQDTGLLIFGIYP